MVCERSDAVFPLVGTNLCVVGADLRVRPQTGLKGEGAHDRHVAEFTDQFDGGCLLFFRRGVRLIEQDPENRNASLPEPHEG